MKWALITGASGDIGAATARRLAGEGWSLYLHYHSNRMRVVELLEECLKDYPEQEFLLVQIDLGADGIQDQIRQQIFSVDALVFAHGITEYGLLSEITAEKMDILWKMHVKAPVLITQSLEAKLGRSEQARIVFVSSVYGVVGSSNEVFYSTVKGAQIAFVKAYSKEVASRGITVNAVCPGAVETHMNQHFTTDERDMLEADIPLGRLAAPHEISFWVAKLLEHEGGYMTGQALTISGGWLS